MDNKSLAMGLVFVILWSSAFTSAKIIVEHAPPFLALSVRFFLTGTFGLIISNIFYERIKFTRVEWFSIIAFGICQNSIYLGLNFAAMEKIDAFLAVIIASLLPVMVAIISWFMKIEKIEFSGVIGMLLGLIGCWIILSKKIIIFSNLLGIIYCSIGALALAVATLLVKNTISKKNQILRIVSLQMLIGGLPLIIISYFLETWSIKYSSNFLMAFLYTCIFPGLIATIIWFNLVGKVGVVLAASFHFLNPPMGVLIAAFILSESIRSSDILGIIILMIAIILIQRPRARKKSHV